MAELSSDEEQLNYEDFIKGLGLRKKTMKKYGLRQLCVKNSKGPGRSHLEVWLWETKLIFNEDNFKLEKWVSYQSDRICFCHISDFPCTCIGITERVRILKQILLKFNESIKRGFIRKYMILFQELALMQLLINCSVQ